MFQTAWSCKHAKPAVSASNAARASAFATPRFARPAAQFAGAPDGTAAFAFAGTTGKTAVGSRERTGAAYCLFARCLFFSLQPLGEAGGRIRPRLESVLAVEILET